MEEISESAFELYQQVLDAKMDPRAAGWMLLVDLPAHLEWVEIETAEVPSTLMLSLRCALRMSPARRACFVTGGNWEEVVPGQKSIQHRIVMVIAADREGEGHYRFAVVEPTQNGWKLGERRVLSDSAGAPYNLMLPIGHAVRPTDLLSCLPLAGNILNAITHGPEALRAALGQTAVKSGVVHSHDSASGEAKARTLH